MSGVRPDVAPAALARQRRDEDLARRREEERSRLPDQARTIGGVLDKLAPEATSGPAAQPVSAASHREGQIQQIDKAQGIIFGIVSKGINQAAAVIADPEVPPHVDRSALGELVAVAAQIVVVAVGAEIGYWIGGAIVAAKTFGAKFVENAIKESIKHAFAPGEKTKPESTTNLKLAYTEQLNAELARVESKYDTAWSARHDELATLSDADLDAAVAASSTVSGHNPKAALAAVIDRIVIGWTNFLAQMTHGAMSGWDFWTKGGSSGALALSDSSPAPDSPQQDPTKANVDPKAMDKMLSSAEAPHVDAETGILEVFVDLTGRLLDDPAYQMRLKGVGPSVRARLSLLGRVGDVPINKLVRVCDLSRGGIVVIAGISITADGYVRATNWAPFQRAVFPNSSAVGPHRLVEIHHCQNELMAAESSPGCYRDRNAEASDIERIAEAAQNLSLASLKE